ncbi:MAG TPA: tetratricopeptide repeat protein [Tepidisphaeraceae bacterium]|nr:tetratricopeptide repeat protein [Tepidisphaeraceae bacterium]
MDIEDALRTGMSHHQAGRLTEAEAIYRRVLHVSPRQPNALHLLGLIAEKTGRIEEAADFFRRAVAARADFVDARFDLGMALAKLGRTEEAIEAYRGLLGVKPDHLQALHNLANALANSGRNEEAKALYRRGLAQNPDFAPLHYNLAVTLEEEERLEEAIAHYRQAVALKKDFAAAQDNLGVALGGTHEIDQAMACYRRAMELEPANAKYHNNLIFMMNYHAGSTARDILEETRRWNARHAAPLRGLIEEHRNDRRADRPIRVGYVSSDFRQHACAHFLFPLLRHHDRERFEIFCYASAPRSDDFTRQFREMPLAWRDIAPMNDTDAASLIRRDTIDILVDLNLHSGNNRLTLFARKPAPVQVTWLGYPGTTGVETIDYRVSDPYLDGPASETDYSERTIYLPSTFWCYDPKSEEPAATEAARGRNGVLTFGCLNGMRKFNGALIGLWSKVLKEVSDARMLIRVPAEATRQWMLEHFARNGIGAQRIEFVGGAARGEYLRTYHRIDICLDTLPYNGHTTSFDALWMGVPVVTLVGDRVVGRAALSQLSNLGLSELAARTEEEFVKIAAGLARDGQRLEELHRTLRGRMERSPLMDGAAFARGMERIFSDIWAKWCEVRA